MSELSPKVSICIPSYNHARYLPAALDSALAQTYKDFEIVIADDGSTDDSYAIAQSYVAQYPSQVRLYTHPGKQHVGTSETVNLAYGKARGDFINGLASDDLLRPEKLDVQVRFLQENSHLGWVYGPVEFLHESEKLQHLGRFWGYDITHEPDPVESLILGNAVCGTTVLMRRSCVERVGPLDPSLLLSDWEFWIRLMAHTRAGFIKKPLAIWRIHSYNTSTSLDDQLALKRMHEVIRALKAKCFTIGDALSRPRTRAILDLEDARFSYELGNHKQAAAALASALESDSSLGTFPDYFKSWFQCRVRYNEWSFGSWLLESLPGGLSDSRRARVAKFALGAVSNYHTNLSLARKNALEGLKLDPGCIRDPLLRAVLIRSLLGEKPMKCLRFLKKEIRGRVSKQDESSSQ